MAGGFAACQSQVARSGWFTTASQKGGGNELHPDLKRSHPLPCGKGFFHTLPQCQSIEPNLYRQKPPSGGTGPMTLMTVE